MIFTDASPPIPNPKNSPFALKLTENSISEITMSWVMKSVNPEIVSFIANLADFKPLANFVGGTGSLFASGTIRGHDTKRKFTYAKEFLAI